jgi:serine/threonine-protein kinase
MPPLYRILGQIGEGQFGQVYCAIDRQTGAMFALKNLDQRRFPTHQFLKELSYLVALTHPNIVTWQGIGYYGRGRYLVMDYCEGGTLRDLLEAQGRLSLKQTLKLITDILLGLSHAHTRQIIHCDIKPENILLTLDSTGWTAKISDFGIARMAETTLPDKKRGGYTGSPAYMAPERFYGKYFYSSE